MCAMLLIFLGRKAYPTMTVPSSSFSSSSPLVLVMVDFWPLNLRVRKGQEVVAEREEEEG